MTGFSANGRFYDFSSNGVRRLYQASTLTQYVDSTGDDGNTGDAESPLATVQEAVSRIPENYSGAYVIQLVGAGPWDLPPFFPKPAPTSQLFIIGDRSNPVASNATPSFSAVSNRKAQHEDTSFGGPGTTEGTHWLLSDLSALGFPELAYVGRATLTRGAGEVGIVASFGYSGIPAETHVFTSVLNCNRSHNIDGVQIIGCILSPVDQNFIIFDGEVGGCRIDLSFYASFHDTIISGVTNRTRGGSAALNITNGEVRGLINRETSAITTFAGSENMVDAAVQRGNLIVRINAECYIANVDFELGGKIEYEASSVIALQDGYFADAEAIFEPRPDASIGRSSSAKLAIVSGSIEGNVTGDAVTLIRGSSLVASTTAFDNITAGGSEVVIDGASTSFGTDVFSLDTGSFTKYD